MPHLGGLYKTGKIKCWLKISRQDSQDWLYPSVPANDSDWQISWRLGELLKLDHMSDNFRVMTVERSEHCLDWVIKLVNIRISVRNLRGTDTYSSTPARGRIQYSVEQLCDNSMTSSTFFTSFCFLTRQNHPLYHLITRNGIFFYYTLDWHA